MLSRNCVFFHYVVLFLLSGSLNSLRTGPVSFSVVQDVLNTNGTSVKTWLSHKIMQEYDFTVDFVLRQEALILKFGVL